MAQQKSEDRVVPEGGVMPVERAGSSPGGREGGPGRRNGGAAQSADRDSRKPERGYPQEIPGPAGGDPGGSAEGDRQGWECSVCDDGGGCVQVDGCVVEGGVEQGRSWSGRADDRRAGRSVADRFAQAASRSAGGEVSAWRDPPGVHPQGGGRAARAGNSRRDRPDCSRGCAAGARTAVGADVPSVKSRVSTRP